MHFMLERLQSKSFDKISLAGQSDKIVLHPFDKTSSWFGKMKLFLKIQGVTMIALSTINNFWRLAKIFFCFVLIECFMFGPWIVTCRSNKREWFDSLTSWLFQTVISLHLRGKNWGVQDLHPLNEIKDVKLPQVGKKGKGREEEKKGKGMEGEGKKKARGKRREREDKREKGNERGENWNQVEKWEGGEGNQVIGNFIHPCPQFPLLGIAKAATTYLP